MSSVARHETRGDGYERWRSYNSESGDRYCYVHQLLAISYGADPRIVFSNGEAHVHHKNSIRWDNRPSNIEVINESVHAALHNKRRVRE